MNYIKVSNGSVSYLISESNVERFTELRKKGYEVVKRNGKPVLVSPTDIKHGNDLSYNRTYSNELKAAFADNYEAAASQSSTPVAENVAEDDNKVAPELRPITGASTAPQPLPASKKK